MTLGSLFDGAGTFPFAAQLCGIETLWSSEIEPFPLAVTAKRFPNVKQLGDVTKINGAEIEPVDIITFGSPCQDLSIAGREEGLSGERSGLFMEAIRIIKEMRDKTDGVYPRFAVWENVPGAFSSPRGNRGEDFRVVLEQFCKVKDSQAVVPRPADRRWSDAGEILADEYSVAWRVLDAQFWGVAQMRRRIFLVADFAGKCAGEVLFKREGLSRHFAEISRTWKADSLCSAKGTGNHCFSVENHAIDGRVKLRTDGKVTTLCQNMGTGGGNVPLTLQVGGGTSCPFNQEYKQKPRSLSMRRSQDIRCEYYAVGTGRKNNTFVGRNTGSILVGGDKQMVLCIRERCGKSGGARDC